MSVAVRGEEHREQVRTLRREMRKETNPDAAVARLEQAIPPIMRDLCGRVRASCEDLSAELDRKAKAEKEEVERRSKALVRAERRLAEKVYELTEKDPVVKEKSLRMGRRLAELEGTTRELMDGVQDMERSFAPLEAREKERLLSRATAALFTAFEPHRITNERDGNGKREDRDRGHAHSGKRRRDSGH